MVLDNSAARLSRFAGVFLLNTCAAVIGAALLDRIEVIPAIHHVSWIFFRGFGISFLMAGALGFWLQRYWKTGTGKWVWTATTVLFLLGVILYASRGDSMGFGYQKSFVVRSWQHFSLGDCLATLNFRDCNDAFIFTTTFVRGIGYSIGALLAEHSWDVRAGEKASATR
jgi:hypothetical protein